MTIIAIKLTSAVPADRVLSAAHDFSARRIEIWPAVRAEHFVVHARSETAADVTEGTPAGIGINWERCDYDWSSPGSVVATVTDSNVYRAPGSVWRITATDVEGGGSDVEMAWIRRFRRTPRGLLWGTAFRLVGRPLFRKYARDVIANLERVESAAADKANGERLMPVVDETA